MQDIENAVVACKAKGKAITTRNVHEELGRGWRPDVVALLREYRKNVSVKTHEEAAISPEMSQDLAREIHRLVKAKTAQLTDELADERESFDMTVRENETLRISLAEAEAHVASLRASLAEQVGGATALRSQIDVLSEQLDVARLEAQDARQDLALAREHLRASEERCALLASDQGLTREETAGLRREISDAKEEIEARKLECVLLQAQVAAMQQAEAYAKQSADRAQLLQVELEQARTRLSASEAERAGLAERIADAKESLSRSEAIVQQLLGKLLHQLPTDGSQGGIV